MIRNLYTSCFGVLFGLACGAGAPVDLTAPSGGETSSESEGASDAPRSEGASSVAFAEAESDAHAAACPGESEWPSDPSADEVLACQIREDVLTEMRRANEGAVRLRTIRVQATFGGWGMFTPDFVDARLSSTGLRETFVVFGGSESPPGGTGFAVFQVTGHYTGRWAVRRGLEETYYPIFRVERWCYAGRPDRTRVGGDDSFYYHPRPEIPRCRDDVP